MDRLQVDRTRPVHYLSIASDHRRNLRIIRELTTRVSIPERIDTGRHAGRYRLQLSLIQLCEIQKTSPVDTDVRDRDANTAVVTLTKAHV